MTSKFNKKGKNPRNTDAWLEKLGYYRKNVGYDETCLFRAVTEQLFTSQVYHERTRRECIEYGKMNYHEFENFAKNESEWIEHLTKLGNHMAVCSDIEINLISKKYNRTIFIFDGLTQTMDSIDVNQQSEPLMLCRMSDDHYDAVYKYEHIETAGFCQSIVYTLLYENVFEIPNVPTIVETMLYEKQSPILMDHYELDDYDEHIKDELLDEDRLIRKTEMQNKIDLLWKDDSCTTPFPFKVAKALDPNIYRNIEYDTWLEFRREMRLGEWYYGDNKFILGTKCSLNLSGEKINCYIQEIRRPENKCVVYITKYAERRTVDYNELLPEQDAKPWPLPYRFSKNLILCSPSSSVMQDEERKCQRRRKARKNKSSNENAANLDSNFQDASSTTDFKGCSLQMDQTFNEASAIENTSYTAEIKLKESNIQDNASHWGLEWNQHMMPSPNNGPYLQPIPPNRMMMNEQSPINYQESQHHYADNQARYSMWMPGRYPLTAEVLVPQDTSTPDTYNASCKFVYYSDSAYNSTSPFSPNEQSLPITPVSPYPHHLEMYPPVYPVHPTSAPVIYTTATPEVMDPLVVMPVPSPHVPVYNHNVDMQYPTHVPYVYPHSSQSTWYQPGVTSQGFIFPAPHNG